MTKKTKPPPQETYTCELCRDEKPLKSFEMLSGRRMDYCIDCKPLDKSKVDPDALKNEQKGAAWLEKARATLTCSFCEKTGYIAGWFKRDGTEVDFHRHIHTSAFDLSFIQKIARQTTPLCVRCASIRHQHPRQLHRQLEELFFATRRAALARDEKLRRRLFLEYKKLQTAVKIADQKWIAMRDQPSSADS